MKNVWIVFVPACLLVAGSSFKSVQGPGLDKLMKKMAVYIEQEKKNIDAGKPAQPFPVNRKQFSKAKGPERKIAPEHQQYIDGFYTALDKYYTTTAPAERKEAFNTVVNNCITCHQHECPGPIMRIRKSLF
jgi:mono/diheme cytochrome c family protein